MVYIHIIKVCNILGFLNKHYARHRLNGVVQLDAGIRYEIFRLFVLTCLILNDIIVDTPKNFPGGDGVLPFYLTVKLTIPFSDV